MKKSKLVILAAIPLLASCTSDMEVEQALGDSSIENDGIFIRYSMPSFLTSGDKISFDVSMEKDAPREDVSMALAFEDPLISNTYSEDILFSVKTSDLVSTINGKALTYVHVFNDIGLYFKKIEEMNTFYFVFHRANWTKRNVTSYSSVAFKYSFDGSKISLIDN